MQLEALGFDDVFRAAFDSLSDPDLVPGRVCAASHEHYRVLTAAGSCEARLRGRLRRDADHPVVGDWVALRRPAAGHASIEALLPRRGALLRKRPGVGEPQLIAANLDWVLVISSLNRDFEPRRIERALAQVWEAGAQPVIVLTKLDLCPDWTEQREALTHVARGVPVHALCTRDARAAEQLAPYLSAGSTVALIGSSGVGKTTLTNRLLGGAELDTGPVRAGDDKGRHTTTRRELFVLPSGALLIDTPGMRELGLWDASSGLDQAFGDVSELAERCRFSDCGHQAEPGCAVREALASGALDVARYESFDKLKREIAHLVQKSEPQARNARRREQRAIHRQYSRLQRERGRD